MSNYRNHRHQQSAMMKTDAGTECLYVRITIWNISTNI